ncbi:MAG: hypothetical protein VR68_16485 [Peptococcaceae bacterium BRH_c4a]|nr:MAG: hypothetical protein VR68_16485 [Peptococcaceae bacterium BRH_c4a]
MKLLFVCTGNTCRSGMARAMASRELEKDGVAGVEVLSAGTCAISGQPASPNALAVMQEMGIDLKDHRSAIIDKRMVEEADLILAMTAGHRQAVYELCPEVGPKLHTLAGYALMTGDVHDPYGGDLETYRRVADQLEGMIRSAVDRLVKEIRAGL